MWALLGVVTGTYDFLNDDRTKYATFFAVHRIFCAVD